MSAMEDMFANMLMKALPDNVREVLTAENLEKVKGHVIGFYNFLGININALVEEQKEQRAILDKILERLETNDDGGNQRPARKRITKPGSGLVNGTTD